MPWALSETGPEGVHGHDHTDRGEQPAPREGDRKQTNDARAAEQERPVDSGSDDDGCVDGRFQSHGDTGKHHGRRARQGGLAHILDRTILGAGVVTGQAEDQHRKHDADDDGADGNDPRIINPPRLAHQTH